MDALAPEEVQAAIDAEFVMRVGRKLRRTLYLHHPDADPEGDFGVVVGMVDTEALAAEIVRRWNGDCG